MATPPPAGVSRPASAADRAEGDKHPPKTGPRVLIAVCTLRESENITAMLTQLRHQVPRADLLVVDDDSSDGTAELARRFAAADHDPDTGQTEVVVRQQRGLGSAIAATMQAAVRGGYDFLVNLDADFSHDPAAVPTLIDAAVTHGADVAVGSRYTGGGRIEGWPLHRRWMSRRVNRLAIRRLGLPVSDCSGSMRCYRVAALSAMDPSKLSSPGYSVLEEILHRLHQQGCSMVEVPITFTDRTAGSSKLTAAEAIRSLWRIVRMG